LARDIASRGRLGRQPERRGCVCVLVVNLIMLRRERYELPSTARVRTGNLGHL
jgi:hypothetical protein